MKTTKNSLALVQSVWRQKKADYLNALMSPNAGHIVQRIRTCETIGKRAVRVQLGHINDSLAICMSTSQMQEL